MTHTFIAPAKVNLYLQVLGVRPDGYHELATLMQPLDLCDRIIYDPDAGPLGLQCDDPGLLSDDNLVLKAARAFFSAAGQEPRGSFLLEKNIPVAAGLGGGSSDAAAVLRGLYDLYGGPLGAGRLHSLAADLGADVPFFLAGCTAWCTGIGDIVDPWPDFPCLEMVLVNPGVGLSTAWVYQQFDLTLKNPRVCTRISRPSAEPMDLKAILVNDLEMVSLRACPELEDIKAQLLNLGALGALMSGSGPTVFGVFKHGGAAKDAAQRIADLGKWWARPAAGITFCGPGRQ